LKYQIPQDFEVYKYNLNISDMYLQVMELVILEDLVDDEKYSKKQKKTEE